MSEEKLTKIKEKIKNLLALGSKNDNQQEAISALNKARELMIKYNIEEVITEVQKKIISKNTDISIRLNWKKIVASKVSKYLKVKIYIGYESNLCIYGYENDVNLAEIFIRNILETSNNQANKYLKGKKLTTAYKNTLKNDFIMSFVESIIELWETQDKQQSNALIVVLAPEVTNSYNNYIQGTPSQKTSIKIARNQQAIQEGRQAGINFINQKAILNR